MGAGNQRAFHRHLGGEAALLVHQLRAGAQNAALDEAAEGDARRLAPGRRGDHGAGRRARLGLQPAPGGLDIGRMPLDADEMPVQALGHRGGGAGAEERVDDDVPRAGGGEDHPVQQRFGFLGRMQFQPVHVAQPLRAGAERHRPVAAHLQIVVQGLHGLIVEFVPRFLGFRGPDHGLMRVGEAPAAEIGHRVGFAPDHVIEDPEAEILQNRADAENIMVAADHPERAVLAQDAAAFAEPVAGEGVIGGEIVEPVPVVVDAVDEAVIGTAQLPAQLQVIRRICEDTVHRGVRQHAQHVAGIAEQDLVKRQFAQHFHGQGKPSNLVLPA